MITCNALKCNLSPYYNVIHLISSLILVHQAITSIKANSNKSHLLFNSTLEPQPINLLKLVPVNNSSSSISANETTTIIEDPLTNQFESSLGTGSRQQYQQQKPPYVLSQLNGSSLSKHNQDQLLVTKPPAPVTLPVFFIRPHPELRAFVQSPQVIYHNQRFKFPIVNSSLHQTTQSVSQQQTNDQLSSIQAPTNQSIKVDKEDFNRDSLAESEEFFGKSDRQTMLLNNAEDEFERQLKVGLYKQINQSSTSSDNNRKQANWTDLIRQATESNVMESLMVTNKTMVSLLCDSNQMLIRFKFRQPFHGVVMTNLDRSSKKDTCALLGTGKQYYEWRLALNDCGTRQEMPRLFMNSIRIRFYHQHHGEEEVEKWKEKGRGKSKGEANHEEDNPFELADDEVKTIVCSYPLRPRAPPPSDLVDRSLIDHRKESDRIIDRQQEQLEPARLIYYEPIVLISGLLLLSLTLLGLATSAYLFTASRRKRKQNLRAGGMQTIRAGQRRPLAQVPKIRLDPELLREPSVVSRMNKPRARQDNRRDRIVGKRYREDLWNKSSSDRKIKIEREHDIGRNNETSADSLADDSKSASTTTIEIPFIRTEVDREQTPTPISGSSTWTKKILHRKLESSLKSEHLVTTRRLSAKTNDDLKKSNQPQPFGSLRAKLTSPSEYKRLQTIADIFSERLVEDESDGNRLDKVVLYQLNPSKYREEIETRLSESERRSVRNLFDNDELFRSLVVDSTTREVFERKLKNSTSHSNKLTQETWKLLEEILLDPNLTLDHEPKSTSKRTSKDMGCNTIPIPEQQQLDNPKESSRYDTMIKQKPIEIVHRVSPELRLIKKEPDIKTDAATIRVSKFNTSTTKRENGGGLSSTLININSEMNFSSSKDFTAFTRSRIEHTRYKSSSENEDSLPFMDK